MSTTKDAVEQTDMQIDILSRRGGIHHVGSLLAAKQDRLNLQYFDVLCMVQIGVNSMAEQYLRRFIKELRQYPEYLKFGLKHELELIEADMDRYLRKLIQALSTRSQHIDMDPMEMQCKVADMADYSDEQIGSLMDEMMAYLDRHTPKAGDCCPRDPELYRLMHATFAITSLSALIYQHNREIFPQYFSHIKMSFMDMTVSMQRMNKVMSMLLNGRLLNKFGRPLKINSFAIWDRPEWKGQKDETGAYRSGLMPRLRDAFLSTKYIDSLYIIRDGNDPKFRELAGSFFEGMRQSNDIKVANQ